jgi:hypothetical protein
LQAPAVNVADNVVDIKLGNVNGNGNGKNNGHCNNNSNGNTVGTSNNDDSLVPGMLLHGDGGGGGIGNDNIDGNGGGDGIGNQGSDGNVGGDGVMLPIGIGGNDAGNMNWTPPTSSASVSTVNSPHLSTGLSALAGSLVSSPEQVRGQVIALTKTHVGSRFIQQQLKNNDDGQWRDVFFLEMAPRSVELMTDSFGHFAIERLIQVCDDEQLVTILNNVEQHIARVCCQKYGSFSVQGLMDMLRKPEHIRILATALQRDASRIISHPSGHFTMLRFIHCFPYPYTDYLIKVRHEV